MPLVSIAVVVLIAHLTGGFLLNLIYQRIILFCFCFLVLDIVIDMYNYKASNMLFLCFTVVVFMLHLIQQCFIQSHEQSKGIQSVETIVNS